MTNEQRNYIDREEMLRLLKKADVPVTRNELAIINALPTLTDVGEQYKEKLGKVEKLAHDIHYYNKYSVEPHCVGVRYRRKKHADN